MALVPTDASARDGDEVGELLERLESREPSPEDLAVAADVLAAAHAALPDPTLRDVLDLLLQDGYSQPEIARALGCSLTTVGRRVAEIRARLTPSERVPKARSHEGSCAGSGIILLRRRVPPRIAVAGEQGLGLATPWRPRDACPAREPGS